MDSFGFSRVAMLFSLVFFVHALFSGQKMKKNECFACLVRFFQDRFFYGKIWILDIKI